MILGKGQPKKKDPGSKGSPCIHGQKAGKPQRVEKFQRKERNELKVAYMRIGGTPKQLFPPANWTRGGGDLRETPGEKGKVIANIR